MPSDGKPNYKARLVAKGFKQYQGVDFDEIFSPVVRMTTLRCVLPLVAKDMDLVQMDVKTTFLHDDLHEDIYMHQQEGFVDKGKKHLLVCKLKKSLYGLKQAPRECYHKFHAFMLSQGYHRSNVDPCYTKQAMDGSLLIFILMWMAC